MSADIGLQGVLLANSDITDIVANRVRVDRAPQDELSTTHIVIEIVDEEPLLMLDTATGGLAFADIDIDCKAQTAADAEDLAVIVRDHIKDYTGALGSGHVCRAVLFRGIISDFEKPVGDTDTGRHVRNVDVQIQYEPNP